MNDSSTRAVSQAQIDAYGEASGGNGLIHTDPEYARGTPFGATLVQGIYLFALIEGRLTRLHPEWPERGVLDVTFIGPVKADRDFRIDITTDPDDPDRMRVHATTPEGDAVAGSAWLR